MPGYVFGECRVPARGVLFGHATAITGRGA
jgi:hypothetical protein